MISELRGLEDAFEPFGGPKSLRCPAGPEIASNAFEPPRSPKVSKSITF